MINIEIFLLKVLFCCNIFCYIVVNMLMKYSHKHICKIKKNILDEKFNSSFSY